jgi:hypothetical protein
VDGKCVEGIVKAQPYFDSNGGIAKNSSDGADRHACAWCYEARSRGNAHKACDSAGCHSDRSGFVIAPGFDKGPCHQTCSR